MLPPLRLHLPPQTPSACSRQERTRLSKWQRAQERGLTAMQNLHILVCSHRIVQLALYWHSVVMQLMKLTGMQACSRDAAAEMRRHTTCTQMRTQTHTHTHTYTHMHSRTHLHRHTHAQTHMHMRAHTHNYTNTHSCTHSSYSTQAARKASTRVQQQ